MFHLMGRGPARPINYHLTGHGTARLSPSHIFTLMASPGPAYQMFEFPGLAPTGPAHDILELVGPAWPSP